MEQLPNYDNWKTRAPEDEADLHERRLREAGRSRFFFDVDKNAESPVHVDKRDALIRELRDALSGLLDEFNSRIALIETCDLDDDEIKAMEFANIVLDRAREAGYERDER